MRLISGAHGAGYRRYKTWIRGNPAIPAGSVSSGNGSGALPPDVPDAPWLFSGCCFASMVATLAITRWVGDRETCPSISACCLCSPCAIAGISAGCRRRSTLTLGRLRSLSTTGFPAVWAYLKKGSTCWQTCGALPMTQSETALAGRAAPAASRAQSVGITTSRWTSGRQP